MVITQHGELVADIPNKALTDDAPVYRRPVGTWTPPVPSEPSAAVLAAFKKPRNYGADLKKLLGSANICDKRWVFEQYDSMVQTNTVQGPGGEAGVMRIKGTGELMSAMPYVWHPESWSWLPNPLRRERRRLMPNDPQREIAGCRWRWRAMGAGRISIRSWARCTR